MGDWSQLKCQLHHHWSNDTQILPVSAVRPSEFLCPYETHCFALCMCCDFFACDCRMKCSDGCQCFHDQVIIMVQKCIFLFYTCMNIEYILDYLQTWSSNIIECGNRQHATVPEFIPMDATSVYLVRIKNS